MHSGRENSKRYLEKGIASWLRATSLALKVSLQRPKLAARSKVGIHIPETGRCLKLFFPT